MKKCNLLFLLLVITSHHIDAVKHERNGVVVEVTAVPATEYAINAHGWKLTADQLSKKGLKAFSVTIRNDSDTVVTALTYMSGNRNVASTDIAGLFQYKQKTRAFLQFVFGIGTCYAAWKILTAEMLMHGLKLSLIMAAKGRSLSTKDKNRDAAAYLKLWKQFSRWGWLGIGQYPPQFFAWRKTLKISTVPYKVFYTGLATMATAPFAWLLFYLSNKRCECACQETELAAEYNVLPGQSIQKIVIARADQPGTFGCELFEPGADDPCAIFTTLLTDIEKEVISESII